MDVFAKSPLPTCCLSEHSTGPLWQNEAWGKLSTAICTGIVQQIAGFAVEAPRWFPLDSNSPLAGSRVSVQPLAAPTEVLVQLWPPSSGSEGRSTPTAFEQRLLELGQAGARTLHYPWHETWLGPVASWPVPVQTAALAVLDSDSVLALWLGGVDDLLLIHNEAYAAQFPGLDVFGSASRTGYGAQSAAISAVYQGVRSTRTRLNRTNEAWIFPDADGRDRERFFDYEYIPLFYEDGSWLGCLNVAVDVSEKVYARRDLESISVISQATASTSALDAFCAGFSDAVSSATPHFPFLLLYTTEISDEKTRTLDSAQSGSLLTRRGGYGVSEDHRSAPTLVNLQKSSDTASSAEDGSLLLSEHILDARDLPWHIHQVVSTGQYEIIGDLLDITRSFSSRAVEVDEAVVFPLSAHDGAIEGVLILGLDRLRPFQDSYADLAVLLSQSASNGLRRAVAFEQTETQTARLQELERLKAVFFGAISDELRTPFSLILSPLSDLTEASDISAPHKKSVRTASRNALHLWNLFGTLLDYFRLQAGRWTPTFQLVQLDRCTSDIVHQLLANARSTDVPLLKIDTDPVVIYVDLELYEKVVLLIITALMRVSKRRHHYCIEVSLRATEDGAILHFVRRIVSSVDKREGEQSDRTPLDGPASLEAADSATSAFDRLGLTHSLLQDFVKLLHGEVTRELGSGSVTHYTLKLPTLDRTALGGERILEDTQGFRTMQPRFVYAAVVVSDETNTSEATSDKSKAGEGLPLSRFPDIDALFASGDLSVRGASVCVAGGNSEMRAFCIDTLDYLTNVTEATSAEGVLNKMADTARAPIDLLVIDSVLPGMDSWALIAALREMGDQTPVVVLSARSGGEARADSVLAGAAELLVKPFSARELLVKVCSQLQIVKIRVDLHQRLASKTTALVESETRAGNLDAELKAFVNASPVGLFTLDEGGQVVFANLKWHELTGIPPSEAGTWNSQMSESDRVMLQQQIDRLVHSGGACDMPVHWTATGKHTLLTIESWRFSDETLRFVGSVVDVSELRRLERAEVNAMQARADDAERTRKYQEVSVDVFSHELRNPLSAISQAGQLLGDELDQIANEIDAWLSTGRLSPEYHDQLIRRLVGCDETLASITACALHQRRIADDILSFSKLNMRLLSLNTQAIDVVALARRTMKMFEAEVRRLQIQLNLVQEASLELCAARYIVADPHRLRQVLINFLTNAIRYNAEAEEHTILIVLGATEELPPVRVETTRVLPDEGLPSPPDDAIWLSVAVCDRGRGLSQEEQKRLFQRFSQARPAADSLTGSGLGLFISRSIVHLHGGFVEIASIPGHATTFSLCIPVQRSSAKKADAFHAADSMQNATSLSQRFAMRGVDGAATTGGRDWYKGSPRFRAPLSSPDTANVENFKPGDKNTVLVVDDSSVNVKLLERQLQRSGYQVETGCNGQEALELIKAHRPRLLGCCIDVNMPVMDGLTAVAELRRLEQLNNEPRLLVIAVTGNARDGQQSDCLAAGYDHVRTKPYSFKEILQLLESGHL